MHRQADKEQRLTRAQLVRGAAGGAAGLALSGGGYGLYRLLGADAARSAPEVERRTHVFHSRPDLRPPVLSVVTKAERTAPGYLFLAPSSGPGQRGVMIADDDGHIVWFHPTRGTAMNFRAALYHGAPVLTWWEGATKDGLGEGEHVVFDSSYRELARFPAGGGRGGDLHEFLITPHGTALVTAWELVTRNLTSLGGRASGRVIGGVVQELAIPSARVLDEWRSLDHVALEESHAKVGPRFDYFHVNSVDVAPDGDLIVSARNTWAVYKIRHGSGEVVWRLGGKKSDFEMGPGTVFAWQHDARMLAGGSKLSLFDDGASPQVETQSRGLIIALDEQRMRARLLRKYTHHPGRLVAHFMGSMQVLPNGNALLGWGSEPYLTEFAGDGSIRLDVKLPRGGQNYRALRFPWTGHPKDAPRLGRERGAGTLYASWNGATELARWQLRTGTRSSALSAAATVPAEGFETALSVPGRAAYAAAVALDAGGKPLATSPTIRL